MQALLSDLNSRYIATMRHKVFEMMLLYANFSWSETGKFLTSIVHSNCRGDLLVLFQAAKLRCCLFLLQTKAARYLRRR